MSKLFILSLGLAFTIFSAAQTITGNAASAGQTATFTIPVTWQAKITAAGTCPSSTIVSGTTMTCTVTLSQPVPTGQTATVTLGSSDITKITVPATVTIPSGSASTTFVITGL